jgi:hypothetical protein
MRKPILDLSDFDRGSRTFGTDNDRKCAISAQYAANETDEPRTLTGRRPGDVGWPFTVEPQCRLWRRVSDRKRTRSAVRYAALQALIRLIRASRIDGKMQTLNNEITVDRECGRDETATEHLVLLVAATGKPEQAGRAVLAPFNPGVPR